MRCVCVNADKEYEYSKEGVILVVWFPWIALGSNKSSPKGQLQEIIYSTTPWTNWKYSLCSSGMCGMYGKKLSVEVLRRSTWGADGGEAQCEPAICAPSPESHPWAGLHGKE